MCTLNTYIPLTNSPIMAAHEVKAIVGIAANGNCSDITAFSISFILVKSSILLNMARQKVGIIAMQRVTSTRHQRGHCRFRKPSIENWPAYVPVMVELWPAARMPTPQIYMAAAPNVQPRKSPPLYRSALIISVRLWLSVNESLASSYIDWLTHTSN